MKSLVKSKLYKAITEQKISKSKRRRQRIKRTPENDLLKIYTLLRTKKRNERMNKAYLARIISYYLKNKV